MVDTFLGKFCKNLSYSSHHKYIRVIPLCYDSTHSSAQNIHNELGGSNCNSGEIILNINFEGGTLMPIV